jgi:DNA-binding MarR family transcriptional regulator
MSEDLEGDHQRAVDFGMLEQQIGFVAHRALLVMRRNFVLRAGPLRSGALNALVLIGVNPGLTQSEIAQSLILDKGTTAHMLRDLEQRGWIERRTRSNDRRWKGVYLSPAGAREMSRLTIEMEALARRLDMLFTPQERAQLLALLNRIVDAGMLKDDAA